MTTNKTVKDMPAIQEPPIIIDARAAAYAGDAIRVMGVVLPASGRVMLKKTAAWKEQSVPKDNAVVVTDTPMVFDYWDMSFNDSEQMQEVMAVYNEAQRSGLIVIEDALRRYEPKDVIQLRKIDERGKVLDFDSMGITNGHMAVLLAVWAARKIHGGYLMSVAPTTIEAGNTEGESDFGLMPFSI